MKKNFLKKLAFALALAMVVTTIAPAAVATVSAATTITQANRKAFPSIYATGKKFTVKMSALNATNKVVWTSSDKDVATVGLTSGIVSTKEAGSTIIKATIKNKKTDKATGKTFTKNLTVVERALDLTTTEEALNLNAKDVKELKDVVTKVPSTSTDVVEFYSSDKKVITVGKTTGKVTAVANGTATIVVYSKATKATSTKSSLNKKVVINVTVGEKMLSVAQTAANKLDSMFNVDVKAIAANNIIITNNDTKVNYAVKSATPDSTNAKKVVIETYQNMVDGKSYTVKYGDAELVFTATDNKVASLAIDPTTVEKEKETAMSVVLKDANGVILERVKYGSSHSNVSFTLTTSQGYTADDKLYLYEVGNTATANAVYHTFKYDDNAKEIGAIETGDVKITAVAQIPVTLTNQNYTISSTEPADWSKVTTSSIVPLGSERTIWIYLKDSTNTQIKSGYTLESSNNDVLLVSDNGDLSAKVTGVVEGAAHVIIKKDGVVVGSCPLTVGKSSAAMNIVLGKTSVTLSNAVDETGVVTVQVQDQYENKTDVEESDLTIECLSTSAKNVKKEEVTGNAAYYTTSKGKVEFESLKVTPGTYTYKVTVGKLMKTFAVVIKEPVATATTSRKLLVSDSTIDVKFGKDTETKTLTIKLGVYKGGVLSSYEDIDLSKLVIKSGNVVPATIGAISTSTGASGAAITVLTVNDVTKTVAKQTAGIYSVKYTQGSSNFTSSFEIKDTQAGLSATRSKETSNEATIEAAVASAVDFKYDGKAIKAEDVAVKSVSSTVTGKSYFVKTITLLVDVDGYQVPMTATLNKTIVLN